MNKNNLTRLKPNTRSKYKILFEMLERFLFGSFHIHDTRRDNGFFDAMGKIHEETGFLYFWAGSGPL